MKILLFTSCLVFPVPVESESDIHKVKHSFKTPLSPVYTKVVVKNLVPSDYQLGPSYTKEYSLVGKDKKKEELRVMKKPSLFNKNFKVVSENIVWLWYSKCTSKLHSYLENPE